MYFRRENGGEINAGMIQQVYFKSAIFLPALQICRFPILGHNFFTNTGHCTKYMDPVRHCVEAGFDMDVVVSFYAWIWWVESQHIQSLDLPTTCALWLTLTDDKRRFS